MCSGIPWSQLTAAHETWHENRHLGSRQLLGCMKAWWHRWLRKWAHVLNRGGDIIEV